MDTDHKSPVSSGESENEEELTRQIAEQQRKLEAKRAKRKQIAEAEVKKPNIHSTSASRSSSSISNSSSTNPPPGEKKQTDFAERMTQMHTTARENREKEEKLKELKDSRKSQSFSIAYTGRESGGDEAESDEENTGEKSEWEKYSGLRISRRYIEANDLETQFADKKLLTLPQLLSIVCPPAFKEPEYPSFVVFGIIAQKSDVRQTKKGNSKYILFTLTDLNYELQLALHGEAFEKYWKVQDGSVVAVLNPDIYRQNNPDGTQKSFGLSLTVASDVILEIGKAKHLGNCRAYTAKGNRCRSWVNKKKTHYCEYHTSNGIKKMSSNRPELNSLPTKTFAPKTSDGKSMAFVMGGSVKHKQGLQPDTYAPRQEQGRVYVGGKPITEQNNADYLDKHAAEKRFQQRMKNMEIERQIRQKLAKSPGGSLLREYQDNGKLTEFEQEKEEEERLQTSKMFSHEQIRKIGYDPSNRPLDIPKDKKISIPINHNIKRKKQQSSRRQAKAVKKPDESNNTNNHDDDDDLEII